MVREDSVTSLFLSYATFDIGSIGTGIAYMYLRYLGVKILYSRWFWMQLCVLYCRFWYFIPSVVVDYCSLYLRFSLNPGCYIMYELQSLLAIVHWCMIADIKNNAGCNLKYVFKVRFSDSCFILVAIFQIIISERLVLVVLILSCWFYWLGWFNGLFSVCISSDIHVIVLFIS